MSEEIKWEDLTPEQKSQAMRKWKPENVNDIKGVEQWVYVVKDDGTVDGRLPTP